MLEAKTHSSACWNLLGTAGRFAAVGAGVLSGSVNHDDQLVQHADITPRLRGTLFYPSHILTVDFVVWSRSLLHTRSSP